MSEKSDPEFVPDEAEPWDNRPDAVADGVSPDCLGDTDVDISRFDDRSVAQGYGWEVIVTPHGQVSIYVDEPVSFAMAVTIANAILSEVEIAQRDHCSACNDRRVIAIAGPDENGQYDTDDCPACSQPMVCECELDWNCPLHQGGPTAIERINHDWASEQTEIDRQNGM